MKKRKRQYQLNVILKKLMVESDVDNIRLAQLTGVSFTTIARMLANFNTNLTIASFRLRVKNFGISIIQLFENELLLPNRLTKDPLRNENMLNREHVVRNLERCVEQMNFK